MARIAPGVNPIKDSNPYDWLVHEFRVGQMQAILAWLDTCQEALLCA